MYIAKLHIQNFRGCQDVTVEFQPGVNVIIGENNGGKTTALQALGMIFDGGGRRRPQFYDFFSRITPSVVPPAITITVTISSHNDRPEDLSLVGTWLTKLDDPWEAQLTYHFALPEEEHSKFQQLVGESPDRTKFYKAIERSLPRYVGRIYAGVFDNRRPVEPGDLSGFNFQFLKALRDAESELFTGSDPLLKRMLATVLDDGVDGDEQERLQNEFDTLAEPLINQLRQRLNYESLFKLVKDTGASDGGKVVLSADELRERDLLPSFRLHVSNEKDDTVADTGVPLTHNGLGYNNLIYIALTLREMRFKQDRNLTGQNASIFPILVIEEPEAHLHPALQYRLLRSLKKQLEDEKECRQIFITTHSAHITAACVLDEIICVNALADGTMMVAYPGRVFSDSSDDQKSKRYIERFLDATKSSILFARGVIFVEGIAEQLVVPRLAERLNIPLEEHHVALIAVGGITFKHFLKLFGACDENLRKYALNRPVACVIDADPQRKASGDSKWRACSPTLLDREAKHSYRSRSPALENLCDIAKDIENISIHHGLKTFEYDLAHCNYRNADLLDPDDTRNLPIRQFCDDPDTYKSQLLDMLKDAELEEVLGISTDEESLKALFAAAYLAYAKDSKGENATVLAGIGADPTLTLHIPQHLDTAIRHACRIVAIISST